MSTGCKICDDKAACLTIDRYLDQHVFYATIARALTLADWPVTAVTVANHDKHRVPGVNPEIKAGKRDAAVIIKGKVLDALEARESFIDPTTGVELGFDILDKDLQPALKTALAAQSIEDRREQKKPQQNFWIQLYTQSQEIAPLLDAGDVIEGEATEVE